MTTLTEMTQTRMERIRRKNPAATMQAAVITAPHQLEIVSIKRPEPPPGKVLIRMEGCGICATNLAVWEGQPWFQYPCDPGTPGHEGWGVVEAVGDGVRKFIPGDRVAFLSYHAFAEYDVASVENMVRLPNTLMNQPFPGEPLACAINVMKRSRIEPGETVAIVGIGFLGALLTQLATQAGARVIAITRRPSALEVAKSFGAAETVVLDDHWSAIEQVQALTGGKGCDCVIEAVGKQGPLDLASELTREMGRLVIAGYHQDGMRQVNMQLWNWRGLDVINAHERELDNHVKGIREAIKCILGGSLDPSPLYTHCFPLHQLDAALQATAERPPGFMKALIKFQ